MENAWSHSEGHEERSVVLLNSLVKGAIIEAKWRTNRRKYEHNPTKLRNCFTVLGLGKSATARSLAGSGSMPSLDTT